jgi:hypothetical protein
MEAFRFGFAPDMAPAFKFDPTDDDLVAHYLLPQALGVPNPPFAHAIIDADPASLPPPDLLALHGHAASHHAFFLEVTTKNVRERVVKGGAGGLWRGQQGHYRTLTLLRPGGGEVDIKYKRYDLTYKTFDEEAQEETSSSKKRKRTQGGAPSGWVMHEYTVVSPPLQTTVLSHIHLTKGKIKQDQKQAADAQGQNPAELFDQEEQQLVPPAEFFYQVDNFPHYQELPGPSYHHDFPYQDQAGPSHYQDFSYQEPIYYHHPPLHMPATGFSDGSQTGEEVPYQELAPGQNFNYLTMPDQPGPTHFNHPSDRMCRGGVGFSDGAQANDASCYGDNGGGFLNLLNAGEGLAGDCDDGFYFTSGGDIEFSHGGVTQDTHRPNDQR